MNSSKTAQGPWITELFEGSHYVIRNGDRTDLVCEARSGKSGDAGEAAALIAAAPDLLRALKMYRDILIGAKKPVSPIITDAIAKAEGGAA